MDGDRLIYGAENGLSRRAALTAPVAIGGTFALAVQPVQAQTMIVTPADGLTAGAVKVKTKDGKEWTPIAPCRPAARASAPSWSCRRSSACTPTSPTCAGASPRQATTPSRPSSISARAIPRPIPRFPSWSASSSPRCPTRRSWVTSIRPSPSPRARARPTPRSSASPASAGAAASCGCTMRTIRR